jgi:hypothetical protein
VKKNIFFNPSLGFNYIPSFFFPAGEQQGGGREEEETQGKLKEREFT